MKHRLPFSGIWLLAFLLVGALSLDDAQASGGLKTISNDNITIDHGDPPNGGGGVDSVRHPNSGNGSGTSAPNTTTINGRAKGKLNNNRSTRPQP